MKQKIVYQVTFELEDVDKFINSYPNFAYNYSSFTDWVESEIRYMHDSTIGIEGFKLTIKKVQQQMYDPFYDTEFKYGDSSITRGELESLPVPFDTQDVSDETMQAIVKSVDEEIRRAFSLNESEHIDFDNERHSARWWQELEKCLNYFGVPYYEDEAEIEHCLDNK